MTVTAGRSHPFLSRFGCLATLVILAGVGIAVLVSGGAVFNPGRLTAWANMGAPLGGFASHAAFENNCAECHAPFRGVEAARCEQCHTAVAAERAAGRELHGILHPAAVAGCAQCHTDHKGRDFNPSVVTLASLDQAGFDHVATGFALTTHTKNYDGSPLACWACHTGDNHSVAEQTCADCHRNAGLTFMDEHVQAFGSNCLSCHDGSGSLADFDHSQFFPLEGAHTTVECTACHANRQFKGTLTDCVDCHAEPKVHTGLFGTDCAVCHTTTAWTPARLDSHRFPLDHGAEEEGPATCATCHLDNFQEYTCYGCHKHEPAKMEKKHAEKGITGPALNDCAACHPGGHKNDD